MQGLVHVFQHLAHSVVNLLLGLVYAAVEYRENIIFGPFLIVGDDANIGDNISLTDEQITKFKDMFNEKSIEMTYEKIVKIKLGIHDEYEI